MRTDLEAELKAKREAKFKPLREPGPKGKSVKSAKEREQEESDKETVEKEVKHQTFERAKKAFYGERNIVKNPWKDNIGGTMFWM